MGRYDIFGHLANILYVVAFYFKDILWLRILVIAGCIVDIYYRFHVASVPMWTDIFWCALIIMINSYQLVFLQFWGRCF